jgi:putative DNA primase/helicase
MSKRNVGSNMNFETFAEQHGLIIDHIVHDRWTRVPTTDKPHSKNGAYIWDGKMGAVQNWAVHEKPISFLAKEEFRITESEWQKKKVKADADRKLRNNKAIEKAAFIMNNAKKAEHPYIVKKGFTDKHWVWNGLLVVPMRIDQKLVGCQLIDQDGNKKFLSGQITKGAEAIIDAKGRHILVEGYATMLSVRRALKAVKKRYTIHCCFSASNILQMSKKYPTAMVVADHDEVGIRTAKKTGKPFWSSPVAGEDFNDFEMRVGATVAGESLIAIGQ